MMRILVVGASGMLGNAVFRFFAQSSGFDCFGTIRGRRTLQFIPAELHAKIFCNCDVEDLDKLLLVFQESRPDVVVNCVGLVKQLSSADDPLAAIPINSLLPHRLARLCAISGSRFVHISTDCVFSGTKGMYSEIDSPDGGDLYGRSKLLGEVDYPNAITLRTSIIGHELEGSRSLINWFLGQDGAIKGFKKAVFSGLPTVEIARLIRDYVLPDPHLHGLYHVSADPINKYDLLRLVADAYGKSIDIEADESFVIDRSLDSSRFRSVTGFQPKPWVKLVESMKGFG